MMTNRELETRFAGDHLQFLVPGSFGLWIDSNQLASDGLTYPVGKRVAILIGDGIVGPKAMELAINEFKRDRPDSFPPRSDN